MFACYAADSLNYGAVGFSAMALIFQGGKSVRCLQTPLRDDVSLSLVVWSLSDFEEDRPIQEDDLALQPLQIVLI